MEGYEGYEDTNIGNHHITPDTQTGKTAEERRNMMALKQPTPEQVREIAEKREEIFATGNAQLRKALQG